MIKSLDQAVKKSLKAKNSKEYNSEFTIQVEGMAWNCYAVSISYRDVLCYCDKGTATFLVDTYGNKHTVELFDWNEDSQESA
jgi:hypothetical protein